MTEPKIWRSFSCSHLGTHQPAWAVPDRPRRRRVSVLGVERAVSYVTLPTAEPPGSSVPQHIVRGAKRLAQLPGQSKPLSDVGASRACLCRSGRSSWAGGRAGSHVVSRVLFQSSDFERMALPPAGRSVRRGVWGDMMICWGPARGFSKKRQRHARGVCPLPLLCTQIKSC